MGIFYFTLNSSSYAIVWKEIDQETILRRTLGRCISGYKKKKHIQHIDFDVFCNCVCFVHRLSFKNSHPLGKKKHFLPIIVSISSPSLRHLSFCNLSGDARKKTHQNCRCCVLVLSDFIFNILHLNSHHPAPALLPFFKMKTKYK